MEVRRVEDHEFAELIRLAIAGDRHALDEVIRSYMPLFNKKSRRDGKIDEDLRQYIMLCVVVKLPGFRIR